MFTQHSIAGRIRIGISIGLVLGIIVILLLPTVGFPLFSKLGLGTLMTFIVMGILLGFVGMFDRHPVFDFKMRWWLRGPVVGVIMMLMYVLLSYDSLVAVMQSPLVSWTGLSSPFWALADGVWIGLLMGWAETKFAGQGEDLPAR